VAPREQYSPRPNPPPPPPQQYSPRPDLPLPPPEQYPPPSGVPLPPPNLRSAPPLVSGADVFAKLRTNQLAVYLIGGGFGGLGGALLAELVEVSRPRYYTSIFKVMLYTALWFGALTSVLAAALVVAAEWYQRRDLGPRRVGNAFLFGALAGFIAGAVAEAVFQQKIGSLQFQNYVLRTFCWGLAGSLVGALLSRTVPNLGLKRGSAAGFLGGAIGGIAFLLVSSVLPATLGRLVGISALGIALGLAMYAVEHLFREASLEVIWAPGETSRVSLGAQPVTIGGGREDHVFVRGMPERTAAIVFENGQIDYVESSSGARTPLRDGSRLPIGNLEVVVHAAG
jgi:hypothetical protein